MAAGLELPNDAMLSNLVELEVGPGTPVDCGDERGFNGGLKFLGAIAGLGVDLLRARIATGAINPETFSPRYASELVAVHGLIVASALTKEGLVPRNHPGCAGEPIGLQRLAGDKVTKMAMRFVPSIDPADMVNARRVAAIPLTDESGLAVVRFMQDHGALQHSAIPRPNLPHQKSPHKAQYGIIDITGRYSYQSAQAFEAELETPDVPQAAYFSSTGQLPVVLEAIRGYTTVDKATGEAFLAAHAIRLARTVQGLPPQNGHSVIPLVI